jgi:hypothetical protein
MKWAANLTKDFFQNSSYKISPYFEEKLSEVATFRDCIYEGFEHYLQATSRDPI